jgi:hypothetical protein
MLSYLIETVLLCAVGLAGLVWALGLFGGSDER